MRPMDDPPVTEPTPWLAPDELQAWIGLIRLSARIVALSDGELRRQHGVTGRDYELLHHLSGAPNGYRITDLADLIDDSSSCITHRVNRLRSFGLVEKLVDATDRRARVVQLAPAGRALLEAAAPGHVRRVRSWVIDALDRGEIVELGRITRILNEHLQIIAPVGD
jgi:DNA-binding MarR family transcriptional regulator